MKTVVEIGSIFNDDYIPDLLKEYNCDEYRVLLPDTICTQEYNIKRLNICINIHKQILDIRKG